MKYKVKITKQPKYQPGGSNNIPSFMVPQVEFVKKQIANKVPPPPKAPPKIKVDEFGIARDQYGNRYYKPHDSKTYKLDPDQGGFWSHVASANYGWNESDYKDKEIEDLKFKNGFFPALGAILRTPENALNATLTGNYEPWSVTKRRYDPDFNPNSVEGALYDIIGDPSIIKSVGELAVEKFPQIAKYTTQAAKYVANQTEIAAKFIAKYGREAYEKLAPYGIKGIQAMGWALENSAKVAEVAQKFVSPAKGIVGHLQGDKRINSQIATQEIPEPKPKVAPKPKVTPQVDTQAYVPPAAIVATPSAPVKRDTVVTVINANQNQYSNKRNPSENWNVPTSVKRPVVVTAPVNSVSNSNRPRVELMQDLAPAYQQVVSDDDYEKQTGGESDNSDVMQIVQLYAQKAGINPKAIIDKLQKMQPEEQQQVLQQMAQELQGGQQNQMAYGGQMGYGLDLGARRLWMNQDSDEDSQVTDSIEEVPRDQANIEAEGGETALIPYKQDGSYLHKKIKGNRHTEGGVPLNVPEGTFIYSDTKKMKLGGPVLKMFGKSEKSTKKFTPAHLAKQYNLDKYRAILNDPKSDAIKVRTAELMIQNFEKKLAQLALVQEGKKGYPQGIPEVAQKYYQQMLAASGQTSEEDPEQRQFDDEQLEGQETMKAMYGMGFGYGGGLDRYAGDVDSSEVPYKSDIPYAFPTSPYDLESPYIKTNRNKKIKNYHIADNAKPLPTKFFQDNNQASISIKDNDIEDKPVVATNKEQEEPFKDIPYAWSNVDKMNLLNSMYNMATVKKATPFEPTAKLDRPETYYTDPSRALAANAEQMNAARQAASMFAGPQSRYSFNAGQYGKNAADIIGQYAMQNVGVANAAAQQNAAINNQQMQYDVQRAKRLYDAGVTSEQQYQNAMRQARTAMLQAYAQGDQNAATLYNINATESENFYIDPITGRKTFRSPKARENYFAKKRSDGMLSIKELRKEFPGANDSDLLKEYGAMYRSRYAGNKRGNSSKSSYNTNSGYEDYDNS